MTTKKLLTETLNQLSPEDFAEFKSLIELEKDLSSKPRGRLKTANTQDVVKLMEETYRGESVEETRKALMKMNRTDLVQRLSDKQFPPLSQRVETMESLIELLLETLADLRGSELRDFIEILRIKHGSMSPMSLSAMLDLQDLQYVQDVQDVVFLMVRTFGQQSVEKIVEVLKEMKRTDLAQRLTDSSSEAQNKHLDEHLSALIHKVATMAAVTDQLLETLEDFSYEDLKEFKLFLVFTWFQKSLPQIDLRTDRRGIVNDMIDKLGHQSVEVIREVLTDMQRTDLVQRLSESSSGLKAAGSSAEGFDVEETEKEKHSEDERWPALIHKVETMESVIELLLEALDGLNEPELSEFNKNLLQIHHDKYYSDFTWMWYMRTDLQHTVFLMVQTYGQQSVEKTMEVLKEMKRTDLAQRLSDCSSLPRKKHSVDERRSALIHKAATMAAVKHLLLETLNDLSDEELKKFKRILQTIIPWRNRSFFSNRLSQSSTRADVVNLMMDELGHQSVEVTREVFMHMNRTDLVQKLPESSSASREKHSVDERRSALIHKMATMAAVKHLLLETLNDLSNKELKTFQRLLQTIIPGWNRSYFSWRSSPSSTRVVIVNLMVDKRGHQSVEVTREVFMRMNRTDLVQKLPESSSASREKHSVDEHGAALLKRILLETLNEFSQKDLRKFILLLPFTCFKMSLPQIQMYPNRTEDLVYVMVDELGHQSVEVTMEVLTDMNRPDLMLRLSESSSGRKTERSSELEGCQSLTQDCSDWTKLEPEVNSTDADEAPTYSLQSAAGHFECRVSGLRWVCKGKTSFQYQFRSWEGHMERMESRQYMPAGPLMDVTVTAGKLNEVHLPHWICIDDIPDILDTFAVLHIDDCGDVVEKVSEVTPTHVKLTEPIFSPRAVLMKLGVPVKINCNVLIYQTNTAFLTLHVYLIPRDPGLQQTMDRREVSCGYKVIRKPHPEKSLKMFHRFILRADLDGAEICPQALKLRYESRTPNFFEVYMKNPDSDFQLRLTPKKELQSVWTRTVRKDEYQRSGKVQENHFVDKHRVELIQRVSNIEPILDELLKEKVIQQESYDRIRALQTSQEKMRELYSGPLKAGSASKDVFYQILQTHERLLLNDLC
ncbi:uncharacterized protein LOC120733129 isoform X1 [Simochromis diagramma]|uniref:uncharacterized protein LOC120733129 isoform X1 n=1 Tax=Simochromis diagramma TaxID=43689 RepID=UPI001A7E7049|nr:uncharacterized protein LOC120733129 isoform X1 [Simochromis diagramma]